MTTSSQPDLTKVTEIFLVPSSFLVAALGTADTNPHRALVSLLGLIVSLMWCVCSFEALAHHPVEAGTRLRTRIMVGLSFLFITGWAGSLIVHAILWSRPLGTTG